MISKISTVQHQGFEMELLHKYMFKYLPDETLYRQTLNVACIHFQNLFKYVKFSKMSNISQINFN